MSADYDNMIGTIPPGFLAPADGNYAPNAPQRLRREGKWRPRRRFPVRRTSTPRHATLALPRRDPTPEIPPRAASTTAS